MAMEPPQQRYHTLEDPGFPRSAREAREQARAARNGSSPRYRRPQSPEGEDDYRFGDEDARSPTSDVALQDAMLAQAQQQQQRVVPVNQLNRGGGPRRQPPNGMPNKNGGSMPPGYPGPPVDDGQPQPQPQPQPREGGRYRRHARRPSDAERPNERPNPGSSSSLPRNGPSGSPQGPPNPQQNRMSQSIHDSPQQQQQQRRPPSPQGLTVPGADINRINSPSIATSVLLPLEQKIREYEHLMDEANSQMAQLDEEILALSERRRLAEERFIEAKSKHDEYERQHMDVGRALRGEVERERAAPPPPRPMPRMESMDSFDRPVSVQSSIQKPKGRGMLRMSLFNKSS